MRLSERFKDLHFISGNLATSGWSCSVFPWLPDRHDMTDGRCLAEATATIANRSEILVAAAISSSAPALHSCSSLGRAAPAATRNSQPRVFSDKQVPLPSSAASSRVRAISLAPSASRGKHVTSNFSLWILRPPRGLKALYTTNRIFFGSSPARFPNYPHSEA